MKQYLKLACIALAIAISVPILFRILNAINPPPYTEYINPTPQQLHEIFFSGEPHIIFCTNRTGSEVPRLVKRVSEVALELSTPLNDPQDSEESLTLTKLEKERAYKEGILHSKIHPIKVGTFDCSGTLLPSGKTILERFSLTLPPIILPGGAQPSSAQQQTFITSGPLPPAFLIGNGERPQWIPNELFSKEDRLIPTLVVRHALPRLSPKSTIVTSEKFLGTKCTSKKSCLLVLHSGSSNLFTDSTSISLRSIHHKFPNIPIVTVDIKKHTIDLQKNLGPLEDKTGQQSKWPRLLYFRRQPKKEDSSSASASSSSSSKTKQKVDDSTLFVKSYKGRMTSTDVLNFLESLTDIPIYASNGTLITSSSSPSADGIVEKPKTSKMAVLKRPPRLNYGPNNFKKPPKPIDHTPKKQQQQQQQQAKKSTTAEEKKAEQERLEREEREREVRRRQQMEEEAEEHNFVQEASEQEEGEIEEPTEDEEVVSLDEI